MLATYRILRPQVAWSLSEVSPNQRLAPLAGVDEAGRGPLAGPVCAAAVILPEALLESSELSQLNDSKRCTPRVRQKLEKVILSEALSTAIAWATVEEIDRLNILEASMLAMKRAIEALKEAPQSILVDGNHLPQLAPSAPTPIGIVKGDQLIPAISAASILAKEARDREMIQLAERYPEYGFEKHKGYPTPAHLEALKRYGVSCAHRQSFAPVRKLLEPHRQAQSHSPADPHNRGL